MARILVVDDSPTETHQFVNVLAKHGHQVLTAASGSDGIELANEELPDVILMDVVMPGLNGFQATRQLTRDTQTRHIPVIVCTSLDAGEQAQQVGAAGFNQKPIDEKYLIREIRRLTSHNNDTADARIIETTD